jgi:hypothetical protein
VNRSNASDSVMPNRRKATILRIITAALPDKGCVDGARRLAERQAFQEFLARLMQPSLHLAPRARAAGRASFIFVSLNHEM